VAVAWAAVGSRGRRPGRVVAGGVVLALVWWLSGRGGRLVACRHGPLWIDESSALLALSSAAAGHAAE
jgi:hypothetical protein